MTSPDSAESLEAKAMDDKTRAEALLAPLECDHPRNVEALAQAFAEVRREERERCAKICDEARVAWEGPDVTFDGVVAIELANAQTAGAIDRVSEAIRALSPEGPKR